MRSRIWFVASMWVFNSAPNTSAQDGEETPLPSPPPPRVTLEFPLVDLPFNSSNGGRFPSMNQSLATTKDFYYASHLAIEQLINPRASGFRGFLARFAIVLFDGLTSPLPLGQSWLHEEYHRAVMSNRNIDSHNGVYDYAGGDVIPVDQVRDKDLIRLKRDHPADQIRMSSAGMEAEHDLALSIERDHFFLDTTTFDTGVLYLSKLGPLSYLSVCASKSSAFSTDEMNRKEPTIPERDFTGLDCNGWVYDLFRPDEPYESRGVHPTGTGINRYRDYFDLTPAERKYLDLQAQLSFLNFVDPFLIGKEGFDLEAPWMGFTRWNLNLRHELTSFGHTIDANLFLKNADVGYLSILHLYHNRSQVLPGLEIMQIYRKRAAWRPSYRMMLWLQPRDHEFFTKKPQPGGLVAARWHAPAYGRISPYIELQAKTQGWVAGNVALQRAVAGRIGIEGTINP